MDYELISLLVKINNSIVKVEFTHANITYSGNYLIIETQEEEEYTLSQIYNLSEISMIKKIKIK